MSLSKTAQSLAEAMGRLEAMRLRMVAGAPVEAAEYYTNRAAVMTRAAMCARAGEGGPAVAGRMAVDELPPLPPSGPAVWDNPHACGAARCILRPQGAPVVVGPPSCRCLDEHLPPSDRVRVREGVRWLAGWAGRAAPARMLAPSEPERQCPA